ncbi:MAG: aminoacyl-tRNA hydrolase [Bacteroidia bacterium]
MKYLIAGLGNIGPKYSKTRHNVGFMVLDELAKTKNVPFEECKLGSIAKFRLKNKQVVLLKPNTFMNLSGKAVRYWLQAEKIQQQNLLVVTDDIAINEGLIRMKGKGSDGGHNGLKNINELLGNNNYPRLRFGVGNDYSKGKQVDFVLGEWDQETFISISQSIVIANKAIESFVLEGLPNAMNKYNNKRGESFSL